MQPSCTCEQHTCHFLLRAGGTVLTIEALNARSAYPFPTLFDLQLATIALSTSGTSKRDPSCSLGCRARVHGLACAWHSFLRKSARLLEGSGGRAASKTVWLRLSSNQEVIGAPDCEATSWQGAIHRSKSRTSPTLRSCALAVSCLYNRTGWSGKMSSRAWDGDPTSWVCCLSEISTQLSTPAGVFTYRRYSSVKGNVRCQDTTAKLQGVT